MSSTTERRDDRHRDPSQDRKTNTQTTTKAGDLKLTSKQQARIKASIQKQKEQKRKLAKKILDAPGKDTETLGKFQALKLKKMVPSSLDPDKPAKPLPVVKGKSNRRWSTSEESKKLDGLRHGTTPLVTTSNGRTSQSPKVPPIAPIGSGRPKRN